VRAAPGVNYPVAVAALVVVLISTVIVAAAIVTYIFCFVVAGTSRGAYVDPKVFLVMPWAGIVAIVFFWIAMISLGIYFSTYQPSS